MKILLADDHAVVRKGLRQILTEGYPEAQFEEVSTTQETLERLSRESFDVLVLDIFMPGRSGLEILHSVGRVCAPVPVLVVSSAPEEQLAIRVLKAGARGYVNKQATPEELVVAVGHLLAGNHYVSVGLAQRLAVEIGREDECSAALLSDREFAVLQLLLTGRSIKEISAELSLSVKTVSTYHTRIWAKLGVKNDIELVHYAIDHRLVGPKP